MSFSKKVWLMVLGLFLAVIVVEGILRLGGFLFFAGQNFRNNMPHRTREVYRILCLGESTTALGGEQSWPRQLEEIINSRSDTVAVQVINKGIPGGSSVKILKQLKDNLDSYQPEMVIVMMGVNDEAGILPQGNKDEQVGMLPWQRLKTYKLMRLIAMRITQKHELKKQLEDNDSEGACFALGWQYMDSGYIDKAKQSFTKVLVINPKNEGAYMSLGDCYLFTGNLKEAGEMFLRALAIDPGNYDIYIKLGWIYNGFKQYDQAERQFKKAIEINPRKDRAYCRLGRCYYDSRQYEKAEKLYLQAMEINPQSSEAYGELGNLYLKLQQYEKGCEIFAQAIKKAPNNSKAWGVLALLYLENKNYSQSRKCFEVADSIRTDGVNNQAWLNYNILKDTVLARNIQLVCVQYPLRDLNQLKEKLLSHENIIFVDNEESFKQAVKNTNYFEYFSDIFAGNFGHCTAKGNRLLAENIYNAIINNGGVTGYSFFSRFSSFYDKQ